MEIERVDGKIQSGVKPPQSKKQGSGLNFWKMITFASWCEIPSPSALRPTLLSDFKFQVSASPQALDSLLSTQSPYLRDTPTAGFRMIQRHRASMRLSTQFPRRTTIQRRSRHATLRRRWQEKAARGGGGLGKRISPGRINPFSEGGGRCARFRRRRSPQAGHRGSPL
jgi:hypothetical protein